MGTTPSTNSQTPSSNSIIDQSPKTPKSIILPADKENRVNSVKTEQNNSHKGDPNSNLVPTMFSWSGGGEQVFVAGTFTNWKRIPLTRSQSDFTAILNVQPGQQQYKFFVDGEWKCAEDQPTVQDLSGNVNNALYIDKTDPHPPNILDTSSGSPVGEYSQHIPDDFGSLPMNAVNHHHGRSASNGRPQGPVPFREPPTVPPHLLRSVLNSKIVDERDIAILPVPHSVMLSHLYVLKTHDNDVITLAVTNRYKEKFVTTIFYKKLRDSRHDRDV